MQMVKKAQAAPYKKPVANARTAGSSNQLFSSESAPEPLFEQAAGTFDCQNWQDMPFFAQIEKDRRESNIRMSRKYNLNLSNEDIF